MNQLEIWNDYPPNFLLGAFRTFTTDHFGRFRSFIVNQRCAKDRELSDKWIRRFLILANLMFGWFFWLIFCVNEPISRTFSKKSNTIPSGLNSHNFLNLLFYLNSQELCSNRTIKLWTSTFSKMYLSTPVLLGLLKKVFLSLHPLQWPWNPDSVWSTY